MFGRLYIRVRSTVSCVHSSTRLINLGIHAHFCPRRVSKSRATPLSVRVARFRFQLLFSPLVRWVSSVIPYVPCPLNGDPTTSE